MPESAEIFVGRQHELDTLRAEFDAARRGRGRFALLSGEPGIGKTRTATELAELVESEGASLVWGRCHEEAGAPPYWPWRQVIRACATRLDPTALAADLGADASEIGDLVPELRAMLPDVRPASGTRDSAEARFRLFDSVARFLLAQAHRQPLVVILDDLHWSDAPSLRLLEFLAPEIGSARLLLVGTYRENELSRGHPLTDTLGGLTRSAQVLRLRLSGLDADEVRHFVAIATGVVPSATLVQSLHQQTEGNPLFLREVVRFLHQQGHFDGSAQHRGAVAMRIPEGVREVIGRRLNLLSVECNTALRVASVIGREFALDVLLRADAEHDGNAISAAIDEAQGAHIVEEITPQRYQFTHALIRMTLYDELRAGQRRQLHRAVGEALEVLHRRDPTPVLRDLAHHFHAAAFGGDVARAIDYAIRAGRQANTALAFEEAIVCFQSALDMLEQDQTAQRSMQAALLFELGESRRKLNDFATAQATLREAAALARAEGMIDLLTDIALSYELAEWRRGYSGESTVADLLEEARGLLPEGISTRRVRVTSVLARARLYTGALDEARRLAREAVRMARSFGEFALVDASPSILTDFTWGPEDSEELRGYALEIAAAARDAGDMEMVSQSLFRAAVHSLELGLVRECEALAEEMRQVDLRLRQPALRYFDIGLRATLALLRGDLGAAEAVILEGVRLHAPGSTQSSDPLSVPIFTLRREQGRLAELRPLVLAFARRRDASAWLPGLALMHAEVGEHDAAQQLLQTLATDGFAAVPRDGRWTASLVYLAEVCTLLDEARHAQSLYQLLLPWAGRNIVLGGGSGCPGATDRFLGRLAATLENWSAADRHFNVALALNEQMGALAPLAHTRHNFACMLLARGLPDDRAHAQDLLQKSRTLAERLGLVALSRAIEPLLQDAPVPAATPDNLTPREVEVLRLLAIGRGNADIALVLSISMNTVATHVRNILAKTGCANRTEAAAYAMRHKL